MKTKMVTSPNSVRRSLQVPLAFIVLGIIGLIAAFSLTMDKFTLLENPEADLSCNISLLIGCGTNLNSAQGAVFGFPNPLLGLILWSAAIMVGVAMLAGAVFARWFWVVCSIVVTASLGLVVWFMGQTFFVLHVLCPWCLVTWAATIPLFFVVIIYSLRIGAIPFPEKVRRVMQRAAKTVFSWTPLIVFFCYLIVAVVAQLQLDVISEFIR